MYSALCILYWELHQGRLRSYNLGTGNPPSTLTLQIALTHSNSLPILGNLLLLKKRCVCVSMCVVCMICGMCVCVRACKWWMSEETRRECWIPGVVVTVIVSQSACWGWMLIQVVSTLSSWAISPSHLLLSLLNLGVHIMFIIYFWLLLSALRTDHRHPVKGSIWSE